ncbi:MAG: hypothetical protein ACK4UO_17460 [Pseudolabrys sp.]
MHVHSNPFPLPDKLERDLAQVKSFWEALRRAGNEMPFWDDLKPSALAAQADKVFLVDVYSGPERFRFNQIGDALAKQYGENLAGKFADGTDLRDPFGFLRAQATATVEAREPTYYRHEAPPYGRLLLPMWGDGRISMLLGAIG